MRAIEDEAFDELPGGLFNRGFVRAYSEAVGLDPEAMVREYIALTEQSGAPAEEPQPPTPEAGAATTGRRFVLPAAVGGLVVLVFVVFAVMHGRDPVAPPETQPETASAHASNPSLPPAPVVSRPIAPLTTLAPEGAEDRVEPLEAASDETEAGTEAQPSPRQSTTESLVSTSRPPAPAEIAPVELEDVTETPAAPPTAVAGADAGAAAARNTDSVLVRLEVHDSTWMYVELDGEVKYDIRINPPFSRNYTVREALELKIGNPAGVSLSVNGEPVTSLGPSDQVWSATITPENAGRLTGSL